MRRVGAIDHQDKRPSHQSGPARYIYIYMHIHMYYRIQE